MSHPPGWDDFDMEPVEIWKVRLKQQIMDGFRSVQEDATDYLLQKLRQPGISGGDCWRLIREYNQVVEEVVRDLQVKEMVFDGKDYIHQLEKSTQNGGKAQIMTWYPNARKILINICSNEVNYNKLLQLDKDVLQMVQDVIQITIDNSNPCDYEFRDTLLKAMRHMSKCYTLFPRSYILSHIKRDEYPTASGHFGEVFQGDYEGQKVSLKILKLSSTEEQKKMNRLIMAFYKEAISWRQLAHENILPFYGIYPLGDITKRIGLVSPWMMNGNIVQYLQQHPLANRQHLTLDIARGISYLHQKKIVHGQLKSANVLVSDCGVACLVDFGLYSVIAEPVSCDTSPGVSGTFRWLAPELIIGSDDSASIVPTNESDVYAFACICYEIFVGKTPFYEYVNEIRVMQKVISGGRPRQPQADSAPYMQWGLTDWMWSLIEECWCQDPHGRPEASAVVEKLSARGEFLREGNLNTSANWDNRLKALKCFNSRCSLLEVDIQRCISLLSANVLGSSIEAMNMSTSIKSTDVLTNSHKLVSNFPDRLSRLSTELKELYSANQLTQNISNLVKSEFEARSKAAEPCARPEEKAELGMTANWYSEAHHILEIVFLNNEKRNKLLAQLDESTSQLVLDGMQMILDHSRSLDHEFGNMLLKAMLRVSRKYNLCPTPYHLVGIERNEYPVASGKFGDVYKVYMSEIEKIGESSKAFYKEAILWRNLSHRNLLPFYGIYALGDSAKRIGLVSPWMMNGNMHDYLEKNPGANRQHLILDVAQGILYLHQNSIVHGDLKGANVLVSDFGVACLADFGLSSVTTSKSGLMWTSLIGSTMSKAGTIRWQAPELIPGGNTSCTGPTKESDVYAFACVCYEIFTGKLPFYQYPYDASVACLILAGGRPSMPGDSAYERWGLTDWMWSLIEECWCQDPRMRPQASTLVEKLSARKEFLRADSDQESWGNWGEEISRVHQPLSESVAQRFIALLRTL